MINWLLLEEEARLRLKESENARAPEYSERRPSSRRRMAMRHRTGVEDRDVLAEPGDLLGSRFLLWERPPRGEPHHPL